MNRFPCFRSIAFGFLLAAGVLVGCQSVPSEPAGVAQTFTTIKKIRDEGEGLPVKGRSRPIGWQMAKADRDYYKVRPSTGQDQPDNAWIWFYSHRMNGDGFVPVDYREQSITQYQMSKSISLQNVTPSWTYLGPTGDQPVVSNGRITDIAVHPTNDSIVYVATAGGGVWKTTDRGLNWANLTDNKIPTLGCGSLAMAPGDPNHLLLGLGEGAVGARNDIDPLGTGIYRTTNGGTSWALVPGTGNGVMQFVSDIRFLGNTNNILAAAWGGYRVQGRGLFRTTNGGQTWSKIIDKPCVSISVDPTNTNNVVVSSWEAVSVTGGVQFTTTLYRSTDGGASFTPATHPSGSNAWVCELARDRKNPANLLALVANSNEGIGGIWKSTNGGQTWSATSMGGIPTDQNNAPGQMSYNNCIAYNGNNAYFGSNLKSFRSTDGGNTWTPMTDWLQSGGVLPYIHADHHVIAFGGNDNTIYMGTDGGFFVSMDGGNTWVERNKGLDSIQIYRVAGHPTLEMPLIMGCQDNDKYLRKPDGTWHHWPNTFGDAMEVEVFPGDPQGDGFMGCNYNGSAMRYTPNGGGHWDTWIRTYPQFPTGSSVANGIPENEKGAWVTPFALDPKNPEYLWVFLQNLYRVKFNPNQVQNFQQMVAVDANLVPAGSVEIMAFSSGEADRQIYAGLNRYNRQMQAYAPAILRANIGNGTGPIQGNPQILNPPRAGIMGGIACDPNVKDTLWISYTDYSNDKGSALNGRIYRSTNQGNTWEDRTFNLPKSLPVSAIFIDPKNSNTIIVGTDLGCYRSDNAGGTWYAYSQGMPNTVVTDFAFYGPGRKLRAATFGRGLWETNIDGAATVNIAIQPESLTFTAGAQSEPVMPAGAPLLGLGAGELDNELAFASMPPSSSAIPVTALKSGPVLQADLTVLNDSFEGPTLAPGWTPGVFNDPKWGIDDTRKKTGTRSIWCARDGFFGVDPATSTYPPGIESYIDFGPFSLVGAQAGNVSFWYDMDIDIFDLNWLTGDLFTFSVIVQDQFFGDYYFGTYYGSGTASDTFTVDFSNVNNLGNILGQPVVYIRFYFYSDYWSQSKPSEPPKAGVWVDDVVIRITDNSTPLSPPGGVAATTNMTDRVRVTWNSVSGANAYRVFRAEGVNDSAQSVPASEWISATTFDDLNVGTGKNYYYFVKARTDFVESAYSTGVLGKLADPVALPTPTGLAVSQNIWNLVHMAWNASAGATEYQIRRAPVNNQAQSVAISGWQTGRTFNDVQVAPGTNYYYFVQARNAQSQSAVSAGVLGKLGSTGVQDKTFRVTNTGDGTLSIESIAKQNGSAWLQVFPPSAYPIRLEAGQNATFTVRTNPAGLTGTLYTERLVITNNTPGKSPYPTGVNITFQAKNAVGPQIWIQYD